MIERFRKIVVRVLDQQAAKKFYTETLGFDLEKDVGGGDFRWLTVSPKGQPDLELMLMPPVVHPSIGADAAATMRGLVERGAFYVGELQTDDCQKTYAELKAKGVRFMQEPYLADGGMQADFQDDSGNWFTLTDRPR